MNTSSSTSQGPNKLSLQEIINGQDIPAIHHHAFENVEEEKILGHSIKDVSSTSSKPKYLASERDDSQNDDSNLKNREITQACSFPKQQESSEGLTTDATTKTLLEEKVEESPKKSPRASLKLSLTITPQKENDPSAFASPILASLGVEEINTTIDEFLATKGFTLNEEPLGKGNFGVVYQARKENDPTPYIYKELKHPVSLVDQFKMLKEEKDKFWRSNEFALQRLPEISHTLKSEFFLLSIKESGYTLRDFAVPADKVKEFGEKLDATTQVKLIGQLMRQAPGKDLEQHLAEGTLSFTPDSSHFRNIVIALHEVLIEAYPHQLIHHDIKPANIIYDPDSGSVILIDFGVAARMRSRGKSDAEVKGLSNPLQSTKNLGTRFYMAPMVYASEAHGSEVDFFSNGMVLLTLICKADFMKFNKIRFDDGFDLLRDTSPDRFLSIYLEKVGADSQTARALSDHPELREIIKLDFQISGGGKDAKDALEKINNLPYFYNE